MEEHSTWAAVDNKRSRVVDSKFAAFESAGPRVPHPVHRSASGISMA